jgi:hypothetical protein
MRLEDRIRAAWCAETCAGEWTPERPSTGQCAVTALVVQDVYGGELLRALVDGQSHYWNRLPGGDELDLTRDQFDTFEPVDTVVRDRAYVLSFPDTVRRYRLLAERASADDGEAAIARERAAIEAGEGFR